VPPDVKAKLHRISLSAGESCPQTPLWELTSLPRPLAVFMGPTSKRREADRRGWERGKERKSKGERMREEVERGIWPTQKYRRGTPYTDTIDKKNMFYVFY